MKRILTLLFLSLSISIYAQETFPTNGPKDERTNYYAFTNATIVTSPGNVIEQGTLVIKNGKIEAVGRTAVPRGAVEIDATGKTIYPSFIELQSNYGLKEVKHSQKAADRRSQIFISTKKGAFGWNEAIHPELHADSHFSKDLKSAEKFRKFGFGSTLTHVQDGIARGTGLLVTLADERENEIIVNDNASHHFSFSKGSSSQSYPSSLMGSIALLRQSHYDAQWYKNQQEQVNLTLKAWNENKDLPAFFDAGSPLDLLRASKLGKETGFNYILLGSGKEYQRVNELKQAGNRLIIPLKFPKAYDVEDPLDESLVSLSEMKHWEMAPYNPAFLEDKQIDFALTASKNKDSKEFFKNLQLAVKNGLSEEKALASLTTIPAQYINASQSVGSLTSGKLANFIITNGNLFQDEKAKILENWVQGQQFVLEQLPPEDIDGMYTLRVGGKPLTLTITTKNQVPNFKISLNDSTDYKTKGSFSNEVISLFYTDDAGRVRLSGWQKGKTFKGTGVASDGKIINWSATYQEPIDSHKEADNKDKKEKSVKEEQSLVTLDDVLYPFMGYGWHTQPAQEQVLFKHATVWTNEEDGIIEDADVLIADGKIKRIGQNLSARGAKVIDATGLHLTAGIVDEHSHICISRGVNEGTQASSAEVRIGDVVNSEHIALYRVLAGGVTTSQLLHGSANPIGGQSALIKSRWGLAPEKMKFENADGFIKFALGENVKQSNWGSQVNSRFPQTRMGVEQVYMNYFTLAKEYMDARAKNPNIRRDLELEALAEIINRERFITCHSYVQSEINMLMNVANQFGFTVNTFTHILEGYKVADKMKEHGVGGSTFSDWWAYKYEVIDAIPYNATILTREGVLTAINSDDAEMARRLNQEAGKMVKYGGLSQEEAWKLVTLNPAKLLHIDDRVGSIKVGKDADLVLWSDNPLSVYALAQQTYVDGRKYFDLKEEEQKQHEISTERLRLIQKMLNAKKSGKPTQKPMKKEHFEYNCNHLGMYGEIQSSNTHNH